MSTSFFFFVGSNIFNAFPSSICIARPRTGSRDCRPEAVQTYETCYVTCVCVFVCWKDVGRLKSALVHGREVYSFFACKFPIESFWIIHLRVLLDSSEIYRLCTLRYWRRSSSSCLPRRQRRKNTTFKIPSPSETQIYMKLQSFQFSRLLIHLHRQRNFFAFSN